MIFAALAAFAVAAPAAAFAADGLTDREVTVILTDKGFEPEYDPSESGTNWSGKYATPAGGSINFTVRPFNCDDDTGRCKLFTVFASFDMDDGVSDEMMKALNHFNDTALRGRAYARENSVGVDFVVIVDGEAGAEYFKRRLDEFGVILDDFMDEASGAL